MRNPILSILSLAGLIIIFATAIWAFVIWWKKDRYTRQKFAFFGFSALSGFASLYLISFFSETSLLGNIVSIIIKPLGIEIEIAPITHSEAVFSLIIFAILAYTYVSIFKNWEGQKSIFQYTEEQSNKSPSFIKDSIVFLWAYHDKNLQEKLKPYIEASDKKQHVLEKPEMLAWHIRAKELFLLRHRSYSFENEYYPEHDCWIGEEKNTGALVFLACYHDLPPDAKIHLLHDYAQKIAKRQEKDEIEIILILKNTPPHPVHTPSIIKTVKTEAELLDNLVDFESYFSDIRYRVERARLTDSDKTLRDTYTPSFYNTGDKTTASKDLESYILDWLTDPTRRQLALLGEYGQGKSTASLMLCYHLLQQASSGQARIPILIELRGKTLRTLPPIELLSIFAGKYHLDAQALYHLHLAGRLLLIFEGFDEIDLSGDTEARIQHFRTLWQFNHENAKLLITGRPNFFLGTAEQQRALGDQEQTIILYLEPFTLDQIRKSLRQFEEQIRNEIIALAEKDAKFYEVASRPSLLYIVAILWLREKLSQYKHLNSATVIDLFIRHTLRRQQDKHDERVFMVLNSAERLYFMQGIAAYMAVKKLPNQISHQQLSEAVQALIKAIPDAVSQQVNAQEKSQTLPLRDPQRLEWGSKDKEIIERITTDVRSCGLLVTDLSKDGSFKFAHKSYMELLQAQVMFDHSFSNDEIDAEKGHSIAHAWQFKREDIFNMNETIGFLAEFSKEHLQNQGINNDYDLSQSLWNFFILNRLHNKNYISSVLVKFLLMPSIWLCNRFIENFGASKSKIAFVGLLLIVAIASELAGLDVDISLGITAGIGIGAVSAVAVVAAGAGVVAAGAVAAVAAGAAGAAGAVLFKADWLWSEALFFIIPFSIIGLLLGWFIVLTLDLLSKPIRFENVFARRIYLWRQICLSLHLTPESMEKALGKGMVALLTAQEQEEESRQNSSPSEQSPAPE